MVTCLGATARLKRAAVRSVCDRQELLEAMEEQGSRQCGKMISKVFEVRIVACFGLVELSMCAYKGGRFCKRSSL